VPDRLTAARSDGDTVIFSLQQDRGDDVVRLASLVLLTNSAALTFAVLMALGLVRS